MTAVLSIGEVSYIPSKKLAVVLNSKKNECLYQTKYDYLKDYFSFHFAWDSLREDKDIYKDIILAIGEVSDSYSNGQGPLILSVIEQEDTSLLRKQNNRTEVKVTPLLTRDVCLTLEDIKEAFLMPGLINLTLDELKVLGKSDYILTYSSTSENSLLDSVKILQSIIESSFREFFVDRLPSNFELKTLLVHAIGGEDLNIENVCEAFSFTLNLLNTLVKVNRENLKGHFGVSVKNGKENKIILFLGLKEI